MNLYSRLITFITTLGLMLTATSAYAEIGFDWESPEHDRSIIYLKNMLGKVGTVFSDTNEITTIAQLMEAFNIAVVTLGVIVVAYTIVISTLNTAQEGEVMGKKWSSVWIPTRSILGAGLLIPAPHYSAIQIIFVNIIVLGIHAANQVWEAAVDGFATVGLEGSFKVELSDDGARNISSHIFHGLVCANLWNDKYDGLLPNKVIPYVLEDQNKLLIGIPGDPEYSNICGGVQITNQKPSGAYDLASYQLYALGAAEATAAFLGPSAPEAAGDVAPATFPPDILEGAMTTMMDGIAAAPRATGDSDFDPDEAKKNGWMFAGSFYYSFISNAGDDIVFNVLPYDPIEPDLYHLGDWGNHVYSPEAQQKAHDYLGASEQAGDDLGGGPADPGGDSGSDPIEDPDIEISTSEPSGLSGEAQKIVAEITKPLRDLGYAFMEHLTERYDDPLVSIRTVGSEIITTTEIIFFAMLFIVFVVMMAACSMSGEQPFCFTVGAVIALVTAMLGIIIAALFTIGVMLGLYTPMIPYIVFTFTVVGWFILVFETLFSAPIVALGLIGPAPDILGKAQPAVMLITGIFLRPSLMVLGFVAGLFLMRTIVTMINYGFATTVEASISHLGIFGVLALIALYGGLILAVVHECFSLIYKLPDKILRWIGGQVEQSKVGKQTEELGKSVESAADTSGKLMKGALAASAAIGKGAGLEEAGEDEEGEEGDKGKLGASGKGSGGGGGSGGGKQAASLGATMAGDPGEEFDEDDLDDGSDWDDDSDLDDGWDDDSDFDDDSELDDVSDLTDEDIDEFFDEDEDDEEEGNSLVSILAAIAAGLKELVKEFDDEDDDDDDEDEGGFGSGGFGGAGLSGGILAGISKGLKELAKEFEDDDDDSDDDNAGGGITDAITGITDAVTGSSDKIGKGAKIRSAGKGGGKGASTKVGGGDKK